MRVRLWRTTNPHLSGQERERLSLVAHCDAVDFGAFADNWPALIFGTPHPDPRPRKRGRGRGEPSMQRAWFQNPMYSPPLTGRLAPVM